MEVEHRFTDMVRALSTLGIGQHVLMAPNGRCEDIFASLGVPYDIQKFSGMFDLRTQQAGQQIADSLGPHIIQVHSLASASAAAKIRHTALHIGFAGPLRPASCDILLSVEYGHGGRKLDYDILPVPPLVYGMLATETLARKDHDTPEGKPLIGTMIDLTEDYDVIPLLGAIREIPDLHFWIGGRGDQREILQEKARKQAVHDRVHFIEPGETSAAFLRALDFCIVPHRAIGADRLTLEAWACGVCVLSAMPAGRTPITNGTNGFLAAGNDALKWREALKTALADPTLRARLAIAGQEEYAKSYTPDRIIRNYLQAYETALRVKV